MHHWSTLYRMTERIPAPTPLDGLGVVSEALDVERATAEDLIKSGLLGEWFTVDGRVAVHAERAAELAEQTPMIDREDSRAPRALIVKVKAAQRVEGDDREYMGWHASLTPQQQADGVRGWWAVRNVEEWEGALLVATIAGFVVGVWRIAGYESLQGKLHRFEVKEVDGTDREASFYLGTRMKPVRGGVILRIEG